MKWVFREPLNYEFIWNCAIREILWKFSPPLSSIYIYISQLITSKIKKLGKKIKITNSRSSHTPYFSLYKSLYFGSHIECLLFPKPHSNKKVLGERLFKCHHLNQSLWLTNQKQSFCFMGPCENQCVWTCEPIFTLFENVVVLHPKYTGQSHFPWCSWTCSKNTNVSQWPFLWQNFVISQKLLQTKWWITLQWHFFEDWVVSNVSP